LPVILAAAKALNGAGPTDQVANQTDAAAAAAASAALTRPTIRVNAPVDIERASGGDQDRASTRATAPLVIHITAAARSAKQREQGRVSVSFRHAILTITTWGPIASPRPPISGITTTRAETGTGTDPGSIVPRAASEATRAGFGELRRSIARALAVQTHRAIDGHISADQPNHRRPAPMIQEAQSGSVRNGYGRILEHHGPLVGIINALARIGGVVVAPGSAHGLAQIQDRVGTDDQRAIRPVARDDELRESGGRSGREGDGENRQGGSSVFHRFISLSLMVKIAEGSGKFAQMHGKADRRHPPIPARPVTPSQRQMLQWIHFPSTINYNSHLIVLSSV